MIKDAASSWALNGCTGTVDGNSITINAWSNSFGELNSININIVAHEDHGLDTGTDPIMKIEDVKYMTSYTEHEKKQGKKDPKITRISDLKDRIIDYYNDIMTWRSFKGWYKGKPNKNEIYLTTRCERRPNQTEKPFKSWERFLVDSEEINKIAKSMQWFNTIISSYN